MPRADDDPWEYISRRGPLRDCKCTCPFEDHLASPAPLNRHRLRRLGTQLPEGARIAPGRPLDAFAACSRSSAALRVMYSPCSRRCWRKPFASAAQRSATYSFAKTVHFGLSRCTTRRPPTLRRARLNRSTRDDISYEYEKEVRALICTLPPDGISEEGFDLPLNVIEFVSEIVVNLFFQAWFEEAVAEVSDRYSLGSQVRKSALSPDLFYMKRKRGSAKEN